jgi:hypothetical protein
LGVDLLEQRFECLLGKLGVPRKLQPAFNRRHQRGEEPLALVALGLLPRRSPPRPQLPPL